MSRKAWLIVIGMALVWLSPLLIVLCKSIPSMFSNPDYTSYWEERRKGAGLAGWNRASQETKPDYPSIMLDPDERRRAELLFKYARTPDPVPTPKIRVVYVGDLDDGYRPSRHLRTEPSIIEPQQNLSGMYYQRQIVGPNAGSWSINYINGPN